MTPARSIDLNADLGEGAPEDREILRSITSANVSCGHHAGDAGTTRLTIEAARDAGVAVGAHPGFADRAHFGRRELAFTPEAAYDLVAAQLHEFMIMADAVGVRTAHVKPHGALYNMASRDRALADAVARAVLDTDPQLMLTALAGSQLVAAGVANGLLTVAEGFPDRGYAPDGSLLPRGAPGAVVTDPAIAAARAVELAERGTVGTLCIHGDAPGAAAIARAVCTSLERAGFSVAAPTR